MAKTYDTAELRQSASMILETAENVGKESRRSLLWIRDDVPEHLSGDTADALEDTAADLHEKMTEYSKALDEIGTALKRYAFLLDEADKKAADMIQSK